MKRQILFLTMILLAMAGLSGSAWAQTLAGVDITLSGNSPATITGTSTGGVIILDNYSGTVTLSGVTIGASVTGGNATTEGKAAILVKGGTPTILLAGTNTLVGGWGHAGIELQSSAQLTIDNALASNPGVLNVTGGKGLSGTNGGTTTPQTGGGCVLPASGGGGGGGGGQGGSAAIGYAGGTGGRGARGADADACNHASLGGNGGAGGGITTTYGTIYTGAKVTVNGGIITATPGAQGAAGTGGTAGSSSLFNRVGGIGGNGASGGTATGIGGGGYGGGGGGGACGAEDNTLGGYVGGSGNNATGSFFGTSCTSGDGSTTGMSASTATPGTPVTTTTAIDIAINGGSIDGPVGPTSPMTYPITVTVVGDCNSPSSFTVPGATIVATPTSGNPYTATTDANGKAVIYLTNTTYNIIASGSGLVGSATLAVSGAQDIKICAMPAYHHKDLAFLRHLLNQNNNYLHAGLTAADIVDWENQLAWVEKLKTVATFNIIWRLDPALGRYVLDVLNFAVAPAAFLNISGNMDLSMSSLNIKDVNVSGTKLNALNADGCEALATLNVSGCTSLTTLSAAHATALPLWDGAKGLNLTGTSALTSLNLEGCTNLSGVLEYTNGKLQALNLTGCAGLTAIRFPSNQLASVAVRGCSMVTALNFNTNKLTTVPDLTDVGQSSSYLMANFRNNQIGANVAMDDYPHITLLYLGNNKIETFSSTGCTKLASLQMENNPLTSVKVKNALLNNTNNPFVITGSETTLQTLELDNTKIKEVKLGHETPAPSASDFTALETVKLTNNTDLTYVLVGRSANLLTADVTGSSNIEYLNFSANANLASITGLADCSNACKTLGVNNTAFAGELNLANFTVLEMLYAYETKLTSLVLPTANTLQYVDAHNSTPSLTSVTGLTGKTNLTYVNLSNNKLTEVDMTGSNVSGLLDLSANRLWFSKMPVPGGAFPAPAGSNGPSPWPANGATGYYYAPQADSLDTNPKSWRCGVNLSTEAGIGQGTVYSVIPAAVSTAGGILCFTKDDAGKQVDVDLTNASFPGLTLKYTTYLADLAPVDPVNDVICVYDPNSPIVDNGVGIYTISGSYNTIQWTILPAGAGVFVNGTNENSQTIQVRWTQTGMDTLYVEAVNAAGVTSANEILVDVKELATVDFGASPTNICNLITEYRVPITLTGVGPWTVHYDYTNAAGVTQTNLAEGQILTPNWHLPTIPAGAAQGTYTYKVTQVTDHGAGGCTNYTSIVHQVIVGVNPTVEWAVTSIDTCRGLEFPLIAKVNGDVTGDIKIIWMVDNGNTPTIPGTTQLGNGTYTIPAGTILSGGTVTFGTLPADGAHTVTIIRVIDQRCEAAVNSSQIFTVRENPEIESFTVTPAVLCDGETATLTLKMKDLGALTSQGPWYVTFKDQFGTYPTMKTMGATTSLTFTPRNGTDPYSNIYSFTLVSVVDESGCAASQDNIDLVNQTPATITVNKIPHGTLTPIATPVVACDSIKDFQFQISLDPATAWNHGVEFTYTIAEGSKPVETRKDTIFTGATTKVITDPTMRRETTVYTLTMVRDTATNCSSSTFTASSFTLTINKTPNATFMAAQDTLFICGEDNPVTLDVKVDNPSGVYPIQVTITDLANSFNVTKVFANITAIPAGTCTFTVPEPVTNDVFNTYIIRSVGFTGTGSGSCTRYNTDSITVRRSVMPEVTLTGATAFCAGDSTTLTVTRVKGLLPFVVNYSTIDANGDTETGSFTMTSNTYNWKVKPAYTTTYTLTNVTNEYGCSSTYTAPTVLVTVYQLPQIGITDTTVYICNGEKYLNNMKINLVGEQPFVITYVTPGGSTVSDTVRSNTYYLTVYMPLGRDTMDLRFTRIQDRHCVTDYFEHQMPYPMVTIVRLPSPQPVVSRVDGKEVNKACENERVTYTASDIPGDAIFYKWNVIGDGNIAGDNTGKTVDVIWNNMGYVADGAGTVTLEVIRRWHDIECPNVTPIAIPVAVYDTPEATLTNISLVNPNDTLCKGEDIRMRITITNPTIRPPYTATVDMNGTDEPFTFYGPDTVIVRTLNDVGRYTYVLKSIKDNNTAGCEHTITNSNTVIVDVLEDPVLTVTELDGRWFNCAAHLAAPAKFDVVANCRKYDVGMLVLQLDTPTDADSLRLFYKDDIGNKTYLTADNKGRYAWPTPAGVIPATVDGKFYIESMANEDYMNVGYTMYIANGADTTAWGNVEAGAFHLTSTSQAAITSTFEDGSIVSGCDTTFFDYNLKANCARGVEAYLVIDMMGLDQAFMDSIAFMYKNPNSDAYITLPVVNTTGFGKAVVYGPAPVQDATGQFAMISKTNTRHQGVGFYIELVADTATWAWMNYKHQYIGVLTSTKAPEITFYEDASLTTPITAQVPVMPCEPGVEVFAKAVPECKEGRDAKIAVNVVNNTEAGNYNDFELYYLGNLIPVNADGSITINGVTALDYPYISAGFTIKNLSNTTRQIVPQNLILTVALQDPATGAEWTSNSVNFLLVPIPAPFQQDTVATCRIADFWVHPTEDGYTNPNYQNNNYYKLTAAEQAQGVTLVFEDRNGDDRTTDLTTRRPLEPEHSGVLIHPTTIATNAPLNQTYYDYYYTVYKKMPCGSGFVMSDPVRLVVAINPVPTVNRPANITVERDQAVDAIVFTGNTEGQNNEGEATYTWAQTGGPAIWASTVTNGTNTIPAFVALNTTPNPLVATFSVTPTYTYKHAENCPGTTEQFTITVLPSVGMVQPQDLNICSGSPVNVQFTANATGATFAWEKTAGDDIGLSERGTGNMTGTVVNTTDSIRWANYTVTATYSGVSGTVLEDSKTFKITVKPQPRVGDVQTPDALCAGNPLNLVAPTTVPANAVGTWLLGGPGGTPISATYTVTYADNNKPVVYRAVSECGTVYSDPVTITVTAAPTVATLQAPDAVCENNALRATPPAVTANGVPYTGSWTLGGNPFDVSSTVTYADNGKKLQYVVTSSCGTTTSNEVTIIVNATPIVGTFATADVIACEGTRITTPATPSVTLRGVAAGRQYWTLNGTEFNPSIHTITKADDGKMLGYVVESTCGNAVSASQAKLIVTQAPTIATITAPAAICDGGKLTIADPVVTDNGSSITVKRWLLEGATVDLTTKVFNYTDNNKKLKYEVVSSCGTVWSNEVNVTVNAVPEVGPLTAPAAVCAGHALNLLAPTVTLRGGTYTGSWTLGGVAFNPASQTLTYADNGKLLQYVVVSSCGSVTSNTAAITVNAAPTIGTFVASDITACEGTKIVPPTAPSITSMNGSTLVRTYWVLDGTEFNPATQSVTYADNGKYLQYAVESSCGVALSAGKAKIVVNRIPAFTSQLTTPSLLIEGETLVGLVTPPTYDLRGGTKVSEGWLLGGQSFNLSTPLTAADNGKSLQYFVENTCGIEYSNSVKVSVRAKSTDATIAIIGVNDKNTYLQAGQTVVNAQLDCDPRPTSAKITVTPTDAAATVTSMTTGISFTKVGDVWEGTLSTPRAGIYTVVILVTPESGKASDAKEYTVNIEQRLPNDIIQPQFNNQSLVVNNNDATNGGYKFATAVGSYQWYLGGGAIPNAIAGSVNVNQTGSGMYAVQVTMNGQKVMSCPLSVSLTATTAKSSMVAYPNPVKAGNVVKIDIQHEESNLAQVKINVYNIQGTLVSTKLVSGAKVEVNAPTQPGMYVIRVTAKEFDQSVKVIVD